MSRRNLLFVGRTCATRKSWSGTIRVCRLASRSFGWRVVWAEPARNLEHLTRKGNNMTSGSYALQAQGVRRTGPTRALGLIFRVGLIAGTLDISDALIFSAFRGVTPAQVFRFIASGLIGIRAAVQWGTAAVVLGVVLHYFIATSWTAIFYAASRRFAVLRRKPVISGLLYGAVVYVVMNFVVLPLSRVPARPGAASPVARVNGVLALLFCIGLPIALLVAWSERKTLP